MNPEIDYPTGCDYEWFAVDQYGHVAIFTTAGCAPIPISVLRQQQATELLSAAVRTLPKRGEGRMLVSLPRPDDFLLFSSRGFFAYDWRDLHRSNHDLSHAYEMLAKPEHPLRLEDLPEIFHLTLSATTFRSLSFSESPKVIPDSLTLCETGK